MNTELLALLKERKSKLIKIEKVLKNKFSGLDAVIEKIISHISIWYLLPDLMNRPTIINLWGLTGVGKTDLVRTLVSELEFSKKFVEIQLKSEKSRHDSIEDNLEIAGIEDAEPSILFLDEIQRFRSISNKGDDVNNESYDDIWSLLSDGKFSNNFRAKQRLMQLLFSKLYWKDQEESMPDTDKEDAPKKPAPKRKNRTYSTPYWEAQQLKQILKITLPTEEIMKWSESKIIAKIYDALDSQQTFESSKYSKMLIFISGNLDEAFKMAYDVDETDLDADIFHENSKQITMVQIKDALLYRFKPEQISRFGNVHIIYPSLSRSNYEEIIQKTICNFVKSIYKQHKIKINIDKSIYTAVYNNGVFPTQGVRPVLSTIGSMLENSIPHFLLPCIEHDINEINLHYETGFIVSEINNKKIKIPANNVLDEIKFKRSINERACVSVHEAGHAIAYAILFGVTPTQLTANVSSSKLAGFSALHSMSLSKRFILKKLSVLLAGTIAEELIFNNKSVGAHGDIEIATILASLYFRRYGMGDWISCIEAPSKIDNSVDYDTDKTNGKINTLLIEQQYEACKILENNMPFLLDISKWLRDNGKIQPKDFIEVAKQHNIQLKYEPNSYILIDNYDEKLNEKLNENKGI